MASSIITQQITGLATETQDGLVSTGAQTFAGNKTFTGSVDTYSASADPIISFYRPSNGVGVGIGRMWWSGNNAANARVDYSRISAEIESNTTGSHGGRMLFMTATSGTVTEKMRIDASGNLLVGTTSAPTTVWNTASKSNFGYGIQLTSPSNANYWRQISWSGSGVDSALYFPGGTALNAVANVAQLSPAGAWTNASDGRQKTNVKDLENGIEKVLQTKPRRYNRIDVDGEFVGFVAQELKEVIPEVVLGSDETSYGVSYGELVAVAFKAIQEQQEIIEKLEIRLAALENTKS